MEPSSSLPPDCDSEVFELNALLDAFGAVCSMEEIASAYCKSGRDVIRTGELLYELQASKSNGFSTSNSADGVASSQLAKSSHEGEKPMILQTNSKGRQKRMSASIGSVSSVMGKSYSRPAPSRNVTSKSSKPQVIMVEGSPINGCKDTLFKNTHVSAGERLSNEDMEEFLFSMLGEGFQLSKTVIHEVFGQCGYNMNKSMDELIMLAEMNLSKDKDITLEEKALSKDTNINNNLAEATDKRSDLEDNLPKKLLEAIFSAPAHSVEEPPRRRIQWGLNRTRAVGKNIVTKPEYSIDPIPFVFSQPDVKDELDEEDQYHSMRKATKVHWEAMKEYYRAAIDAFTDGDHAQASCLIERGNYYNKMAREADESSANEILDMRSAETPCDITLDIQEQEPKEACRLLKFHLHLLGGIGCNSLKNLKVRIDGGTEDKAKEKRRRLVMKLLEKHSITWTQEESNPGAILIHLDTVDPSKFKSHVQTNDADNDFVD